MPYGFNNDKSKFSLDSMITTLGEAMNRIGHLATTVVNLGDDMGDLSDKIDTMGQSIDTKIDIGSIKVIQGTIASVPAQQSQIKNYTAKQLSDLGISNIDNYIVISCMNQNESFGSWVTGAGNHDNYGYANPYIVEIGSTKPYPLQIQAYNINAIDAMDIIYRIVLMKVV